MTTTQATAEHPASYRRLLATRGASELFLLAFTTVFGTALQIFAVSVVIYQHTGSTAWSSGAFAAGFLPQLIGGTLLTSLADRLPTRLLLLGGAAIRAGSAAALCLGHLSPAGMIALIAIVAVLQPVPAAAQSALVSRLLTGDLYVLGRSVFTMISSGAQLAGLAVGGALIASLGAPVTFGVVAVAQVAGVVAALAVPPLPAAAVDAASAKPWRPSETWHGNVALLRDRAIRRILMSWWIPLMLLVGAESLVVPYTSAQGGSAAPTGLLLAAFPAGEAIGELIVGRWCSAELRRNAVPWLYVLVGLPLLVLAGQPSPLIAGSCFAVASAAMAYQLGTQHAFVEAVPPAQRGLAFGLYGTGMMTGQGVGPALAGLLATAVGAGRTISVIGLCVVVSAVFLARVPDEPTGNA